MAEASRDVKLIAEIRKHNRMIKDAYKYYSIDTIFGQLPADVVEYFHECGLADKILLDSAEDIINE
jgi:hypothetical protein